MKKVITIGGGITGITFAKEFKETVVYEKEDEIGGKCRTQERNGFRFDVGGHWLHAKDSNIAEMFTGLKESTRKAYVKIGEKEVPFPIQGHTEYLKDHEIIEKELKELPEEFKPENYLDMLRKSYGETLLNLFFQPYNEKLYGGKDLSKIQLGSKDTVRNVRVGEKGYNTKFKYPTGGKGIQEIIRQLAEDVTVIHKEVESINSRKKEVTFTDGEVEEYDYLVTTIPLNELVEKTTYLPKKIQTKGSKLESSKGRIYNFGIKKKSSHIGRTWMYLPDPELPFYRVGFYTEVDPDLAPQGYSSMYVECNTDREYTKEEIIEGLVREGFIEGMSDIITMIDNRIEHNYCFHSKDLDEIHKDLISRDIYSIGRYGKWYWGSMHEDMAMAIETAKELRSKVEVENKKKEVKAIEETKELEEEQGED